MHSTVMPPSVQERIFDFRADEARKDAHDLLSLVPDNQ